ncbi:ORFL213C [Human betaherpesvirus 5]|nr:ORFL213C [Human betaherpesvirus 5]QHX40566.1 ORFL213C [Human betaherpesvirus 5]
MFLGSRGARTPRPDAAMDESAAFILITRLVLKALTAMRSRLTPVTSANSIPPMSLRRHGA